VIYELLYVNFWMQYITSRCYITPHHQYVTDKIYTEMI